MSVEKWYVSQYNRTENISLPQKVIINDVFLRESAEVCGVALNTQEMSRIACELDRVGVPEIQIMGRNIEKVRAICRLGLKSKIEILASASAPGWEATIEAAADCGVYSISSPFAYSDYQRPEGVSKRDVIDSAVRLVRHVKRCNLFCAIGPMDITRTEIDDIKAFYDAVLDAGTDRLYIYDTAGAATPNGIRYLVSRLKEFYPQVEMSIHAHNDFGLRMANTFAAIEAGCNVIDTAVNGLARKTGLPPLAEVAAAAEILYGIDTGIKLEGMYELSKLVEDLTKLPIPHDAPIVGLCTFAEFSGPPATGETLRRSISALDPVAVGNKGHFFVTSLSGPPAIRAKLHELGISLPEEKILMMMARLAEEESLRKRILTDDDVRTIASRIAEASS